MLFYSIIALIMSNALNNRRDITILYSRVALLILIFTSFFIYNIFFHKYINSGIIIFNGFMCIENYSLLFCLVILVLSIFIIGITSVFYLNNNNATFKFTKKINWNNNVYLDTMNEHYRLMEYPLFILFCIIGAVFLMFSFDIISIFLSIELQSYALYLICSIYRNSESSTNAGLIYFLLGSLSSCIILLGLGLLYVNTGNTNLENIFIYNNISDIFYFSTIYNNTQLLINNDLFIINLISSINTHYIFIQLSLILVCVGFLFKIGAAPFHLWAPAVYDAVPTITTTFISIIPKISIFIFMYKILYFTSSNLVILSWTNNIIISSVLSLLIGSILGLTQIRIKRLYAYSTISHIGFILLALTINNTESTKAFFFYLIQYSLSNLNAFLILILIGYTLRNYTVKKNYNILKIKDLNYSPVQLISQLKGFYLINPMLTISLSLTLFSFAGIPPLIGFTAKQLVLNVAINANLWYIVLICILVSVISATYYLIVIKEMFFVNRDLYLNKKVYNYSNFNINVFYSFSISVLTLIIFLFMTLNFPLDLF